MLSTATGAKKFLWPQRVHWHAQHKQNVLADWQVATTRTIKITQPHLTAHSSLCTRLRPPAGFDYTSPSADACGAHLGACTLFPTDCTATALPFGVQSCFARESVKWGTAVFGSGLPTAISIIDY